MRKLLLSATALIALTTASQAAFVQSLGNNPDSNTGRFSNSVQGTTFSDDYTFNLIGAPEFVAFASATNDFAKPSDVISNFTGQLFSFGADMVPFTADDFAVNAAATSHPCADNPTACQELSGNATLAAGGYYLQIAGTGGGTAGYGGDLTTAVAAVPEPSTWAMLLLGFVGLSYMGVRRRKFA